MDDGIHVFIMLLVIWFFGFIVGVIAVDPDKDEMIVGSESGYYCDEVIPAKELGEKARCGVYRLRDSDYGR